MRPVTLPQNGDILAPSILSLFIHCMMTRCFEQQPKPYAGGRQDKFASILRRIVSTRLIYKSGTMTK